MAEDEVPTTRSIRDILEESMSLQDDDAPVKITPDTEPPAEKPVESVPLTGNKEEFEKKAAETPTDPSPSATTHDRPEKGPTDYPTTWGKEHRPLWEKLAKGGPATKEEMTAFMRQVHKREADAANGVSRYRKEAETVRAGSRGLHDAIAPYAEALKSEGITPHEWIGNLGRAHFTIARGTPEQKVAVIRQLINEYGVPVQVVGPGEGQEQVYQQQIHQAVETALSRYHQYNQQMTQQQQQQQHERQLEQTVESFRSDLEKYPFAQHEEVNAAMADLLSIKRATTLEDAYNKAVRMLGMQEQLVAPVQSTQYVQKPVLSPRSASPVAPSTAKMSLRETLRANLHDD